MAKTKGTADAFAAIRKARTNGDNDDGTTADIIARTKRWQKRCPFRPIGVE